MWRITCEPFITPWPQIRPIMKQFASGHLGVKHSTVQQLLSWVWVWLLQIPAEEGERKRHPMAMLQRDWDMNPDPYKDLIARGVSILELPGTCRREKCYAKWGCCSRMQRMSWTLPEIAYQLLGAQVRPPTLFWKKLFVQLLLSSKLFANPLKSKSQSQLDFPCPGVGKWGQPPAIYPGGRAPTIHRVHYQQPDLFIQNWKLKHRKRAWDIFLSTMNSLGNGHFSSHLNLCSVFISHNAYKCILLEKCSTIGSWGFSGMGDTVVSICSPWEVCLGSPSLPHGLQGSEGCSHGYGAPTWRAASLIFLSSPLN